MNAVTLMEKTMIKSYPNTAGILVTRKGELLYENYFHDSNREEPIHLFSATKSIVSLLVGIAMDRGYISSVKQKVLEFFPAYTIPEGEQTLQQVTLQDLLSMTAPFKYKNPGYSEYAAYFKAENYVTESLNWLGGNGRIGEFLYAGLIGPDILSGVIEKATGCSMREFAIKNLFEPMGITIGPDILFQNEKEQKAYYEAKSVPGWVCDQTGHNTAGWGLSLTVPDMVRIGELCLNKGEYHGKRIVSEEWILESTRKKSHSRDPELDYGYLWWIMEDDRHCYAALGQCGNTIYINEQEGFVIAMSARTKMDAKDRLKLIRDYIEPAFR